MFSSIFFFNNCAYNPTNAKYSLYEQILCKCKLSLWCKNYFLVYPGVVHPHTVLSTLFYCTLLYVCSIYVLCKLNFVFYSLSTRVSSATRYSVLSMFLLFFQRSTFYIHVSYLPATGCVWYSCTCSTPVPVFRHFNKEYRLP